MPTEWLAVATTLAGAGLGIVGGVWAALVGRRGQVDVARLANVQALIAEKRLLYGKYVRVAEDLRDAARRFQRVAITLHRFSAELAEEPLDDARLVGLETDGTALESSLATEREHLESIYAELRRLQSEVAVVGSIDLGILAIRLGDELFAFAATGQNSEQMDQTWAMLITAMNFDIDPERRNAVASIVAEFLGRDGGS